VEDPDDGYEAQDNSAEGNGLGDGDSRHIRVYLFKGQTKFIVQYERVRVSNFVRMPNTTQRIHRAS
jgi:hypothetical protein